MLTHNTIYLKNFSTQLQVNTTNNPIEKHTLAMLELIQNNPAFFEQNINKNSPFYHEFCKTIQGDLVNFETCFALFECLIIFCRERQLRLNQQNSQDKTELNILKFYEESEHWHPEDGTLLNTWYWHILPKECAN